MTDLNYEQVLEMFTKQIVAVYRAKKVLNEQANNELYPESKIKEVKRELLLSEMMANIFYEQLEELGIPENYISLHLAF
jgi:hypothetical protein